MLCATEAAAIVEFGCSFARSRVSLFYSVSFWLYTFTVCGDISSALFELNCLNSQTKRAIATTKNVDVGETTTAAATTTTTAIQTVICVSHCCVHEGDRAIYQWSPSYMNDRTKRCTYVVAMPCTGLHLDQHLQFQLNVCPTLCSLNHLHESIERLRYTDHSVGRANVCLTIAAITDVVDWRGYNLRSCCCEEHFSYRSSFSSNTDTC